MTESRITNNITDDELKIQDFNMIRCDAENGYSGGVVVYVRQSVKYRPLFSTKMEGNYWCIGINVRSDFYGGNLLFLYHSPNSSDVEFISFLEQKIDKLLKKENLIVMGDFNMDMLNRRYYENKLDNMFVTRGMVQSVRQATRVTPYSETLIDLIYANIDITTIVENTPRVSDHAWMSIVFNKKKNDETKIILKRNFKNFNDNLFKNNVRDNFNNFSNFNNFNNFNHFNTDDNEGRLIYNSNLNDNLNKKANKFIYSISAALDQQAPVREIKINNKDKKWFTQEIKDKMKIRDNTFGMYKITNDDTYWIQYKLQRNEIVKLIHKAKKEYFENEIDNTKSDPKQMYKVINNLLKKDKTTELSYKNIKFDNDETETLSNKELANKFNKFFIDSIEQIILTRDNNNVNSNLFNLFNFDCLNYFNHFDEINMDKLYNLINKLDANKRSPEGINKQILYNVCESIGEHFLDILNTSLSTGMFPEKWKIATVTPIRKVNNTNNANEFRPINQLPIYEKILELIVKEQLENFLNVNKILIDEQAGFRRNYSCETALQIVLDKWTTAISEKMYVGVIFIDFKRAFETIDHNILINKLYLYGIRGDVLKWFKSYMSARKQRTCINGVMSDEREIKYGVPQGSVLGPILFILYINDLKQHLGQHCEIRMFADDTMLYVAEHDMDVMEQRLNSAMSLLDDWLSRNSMFLNPKKTFYMIFKNDQLRMDRDLTLKYRNVTIERVREIKYLGVFLDECLRFKKHVTYVEGKVGSKLGLLNRVGNFVGPCTRDLIYKTMIAPHMEYCSTVLLYANKEEIERLQRLQNRAMRIILHCDIYTSTRRMRDVLNYFTIDERIKLNVLTIIYNMKNGNITPEMCDRVEYVGQRTGRVTRQSNDIALPFKRTMSSQKSIYYKGFKLFNELPDDVKSATNLNIFKRRLREYFIQQRLF